MDSVVGVKGTERSDVRENSVAVVDVIVGTEHTPSEKAVLLSSLTERSDGRISV